MVTQRLVTLFRVFLGTISIVRTYPPRRAENLVITAFPLQ